MEAEEYPAAVNSRDGTPIQAEQHDYWPSYDHLFSENQDLKAQNESLRRENYDLFRENRVKKSQLVRFRQILDMFIGLVSDTANLDARMTALSVKMRKVFEYTY